MTCTYYMHMCYSVHCSDLQDLDWRFDYEDVDLSYIYLQVAQVSGLVSLKQSEIWSAINIQITCILVIY